MDPKEYFRNFAEALRLYESAASFCRTWNDKLRRFINGLKMISPIFRTICLGMLLSCPSLHAALPNVLVIVADDLGYADLSAQGSPDIRTPDIDSLAKNGIRFTDGYATNPLCAPSRAALLTGRYQQRFGFEYNPGDEENAPANFGIPLSEPLLSERLKQAGYATLAVGKWHVGFRPELQPSQRGFDRFYGHLNGAHQYVNNDDGLLIDDGKPIEHVTYTTTMFGDVAAAFVEKHQSSPWFVYLSYSAVHGKIRATEEYLNRFPDLADSKRRTLLAMMSAMDDSVGKVLKVLRETGQMDRTLIVFTSDNGGLPSVNASLNTPLRGGKRDLLEGGVRVPFLMQWEGVLSRGAVYRHPVSTIDIVPTALAAAGLPPDPKLDGVNLLPYVIGKISGPPHENICWRAQGAAGWAIRQGDWKLLYQARAKNPKLELFDLNSDIGETNDLAGDRPEKVRELRAAWERWNAKNIEPLWSGAKVAKKKKGAEESE